MLATVGLAVLLVYIPCANAQTTPGIGLGTTNSNLTMGNETTTDSNMTTNGNMTTGGSTVSPVTPDPVTPEATTRPSGGGQGGDGEFPFNTEVAFCTCDLTSNQCDVNCCCDFDCTATDRQMFSSCDEVSQSVLTEKPHCLDPSSLFRHNSVYEVEGSPGCFARSSYTEQNYLLTPALVSFADDFAYFVSWYGSYSYSPLAVTSSATVAPPTNDTNYKTGDLIYTLTVGDVQGVLMTPSLQTASGQCSGRNPAKFLRDSSVTCRRDIKSVMEAECVGNKYFTASGYLNTGVRSISSPNQASQSSIPSDALIEINAASGQIDDSNLLNDTCINVVTEVTYTVLHTAGIIKRIELDFKLDNFINTTTEVYQTYHVKYQEWNTSNSDIVRRSGNPGYVLGEPVISGWLIGNSISLDTDSNDYLTVIASTLDGKCDQNSRMGVKFGENSISGCVIDPPASCSVDTPQARSRLIDDSLNATAYIASFGNSSVDQPGDWVPIFREPSPDSTQCTGLTMTLEILYAKLGAMSSPQHRIVGAKLKFEPVELNTVSSYTLSSKQFSVTNIVSFVEVTATPAQVTIADGSRFGIRSPIDFFYPFIWATSGGNAVHVSYAITFSSLIMSVCLGIGRFV